MPLEPNLSLVHRWSRTRSRVSLALSSVRCVNGRRRWSLRLTGGTESIELPLDVATPPGLELCVETRTAVSWCAGMLLRELGATAVDAGGAPIFVEEEAFRPEVRVRPGTAARAGLGSVSGLRRGGRPRRVRGV